MAGVFYFPLIGTPTADGYQLSFYEAGTDVPLDVWTDSDLTLAWSQPIILNAAGNSDGPIYVSAAPAYKVVYEDADGVAIPGYPVDFVSPSTIINVMTTQTTVLTNAQIKALPTTSITVVTAPSSSSVRVKVLDVDYRANTTAGAYTNLAATADMQLACNGATLSYGPANDNTTTPTLGMVTTLLGTAANQIYEPGVPPLDSVPVTGAAGYVINRQTLLAGNMGGQAVTLAMNNPALGNLTGGNAANTFTVIVYYALESLA